MDISKPVHLQDDAQWKTIMTECEGGKSMIVDFTASWCGPCKMIAPVFEQLCGEYADVLFLKVDVDECEETAAACGISAMPTFKVYKDGKMVGDLQGASKEGIVALLVKHCK